MPTLPYTYQDEQRWLRRKRPLATTILTARQTMAVFAVVFVLGINVDSSYAFSSTCTSRSFGVLESCSIADLQRYHSSILQQKTALSRRFSFWPLFAKARRSGGGNSKKNTNNKKTQPNNTKKGSTKDNKKADLSNSKKSSAKKTSPRASPTASASSSSSSSGPRAPPWQVLSQKDAKKNVQREKKRREAIQKGEASTSITNQQFMTDDDDDDDDDAPLQVSKTFLSNADRTLLSWKRFNPSTAGMRYVASVLDRQPLPRLGVPEIAFLGRSNVGKSSLLNRLSSYSKKEAGFTDEARVGKTPGATASVNLFGFYDKKEKPVLGFVDLPGFGYAKLSKEVKESVQEAAERYLGKREELVLGILLVDIRRVPSEDDRIVLAALFDMGVPIVVVATKVDKVNKNDLEGQLEQIRDGLGLPDGQPFSVSSVTGEGTKALWNLIMEASESGVEEFQMKLQRRSSDEESDQGNLVQDGDNEEDSMYSQGYDWVQAGDVVYEGSDDDFNDGDDDDESSYYDDDPVDDGLVMPVQRESITELRRRAKRLEDEKKV